MKRTTVSLPEDLASAVAREARRRNTSVSEITRDALASHLGLVEGEPRALPFAALGRSGHHNTGRDMEDLITEQWSDRARRR